MKSKFIFVTGGVVSGIGKGITASTIGRILKQKGFKVVMQKLDPYFNIDAGLINPREHGETFVTNDGHECDLDLGHYERYIDENLTALSSITSGQIYQNVINKERAGNYNGKTVQVVPHIIDEIKSAIYKLSKVSKADINIVEIGGISGDIESLPFYEAIRQIRNEHKYENVMFIHCTLLPFLDSSGEFKTKPTQNSVARLRSIGIQPDLIILRAKKKFPIEIKEKISMFCNIKEKKVIEATNLVNIYELVNHFYKQNVDKIICQHFNLKDNKPNITKWNNMITNINNSQTEIKVAIVGKYNLVDAYLSVIESLKIAGHKYKVKVKYELVYSKDVDESNYNEILKGYEGIIVPGGFGQNGTNGKILAIKYARENMVPFLGICYGMQLSVIEYARNVLNLKDANTTELDPKTPYPLIDIIDSKSTNKNLGIMRLGLNDCVLKTNTKSYKLYGKKIVKERHRHKYEFTLETYQQHFMNSDIIYSGFYNSSEYNLIEIIENKNHPYFIACQFHPEFISRLSKPHPLFSGFIKAIINS